MDIATHIIDLGAADGLPPVNWPPSPGSSMPGRLRLRTPTTLARRGSRR